MLSARPGLELGPPGKCVLTGLLVMAIGFALWGGRFHKPPASQPDAGIPAGQARRTLAPSIESYAALPLAFEPNQGQAGQQIRYLARGNGYALLLASNEAVISVSGAARSAAAGKRTGPPKSSESLQPSRSKLPPAVLRMQWLGGR